MAPLPPLHPLRRVVDGLALLVHGLALLWIPLLIWDPGARRTADQPPRQGRPPAEWSRFLPPPSENPASSPASRFKDLEVEPAPSAIGNPVTKSVLTSGMFSMDLAPPPRTSQASSGQDLDRAATSLIFPLQGAAALGGLITRSDLSGKPVPLAVRAERHHWSRSSDPLAPLPRHWRDEIRTVLSPEATQVDAQVVRLPAPHLTQPEEVPMAIHANGEAMTLTQPSSESSRELVEQWAGRQAPPPEGSGRAVVVTLEPIEAAPPIHHEDVEVSSLPPITPHTNSDELSVAEEPPVEF